MRNIYPKLITTLFLILFAAMVIKYADSDNGASRSGAKTAQVDKSSR